MSTSADEFRRIVRKRAALIMRRSTAGTLPPAPKGFVSGETLPYPDRHVRLRVVSVPFDKRTYRE